MYGKKEGYRRVGEQERWVNEQERGQETEGDVGATLNVVSYSESGSSSALLTPHTRRATKPEIVAVTTRPSSFKVERTASVRASNRVVEDFQSAQA